MQIIFRTAVRCFCIVTHLGQQFLKCHTAFVIAVVDKDRLRLFSETCQPPQQSGLIGVTAGAVERGDLRIDGNILTKLANLLCTVLKLSAERAFCLITHEQIGVFFSP